MRASYLSLALAIGLLGAGALPASALSMKECSTKYQAAKAAGDAAKWQDFRKAQCGADGAATPTAASTPAAPKPTVAAAPAPTPAAPAPTTARAAAGSMTYPSAIDPKYAQESAGKGRMHTCLDAYKAAKAKGTLGTTKWIEKGGGYYSACNAALKG